MASEAETSSWGSREQSLQDAENQHFTSGPPELGENRIQTSLPRPNRNPVFFNEHGLRAGWRLLSWIFACFALDYCLLAIFKPIGRYLPRDLAGHVGELLMIAAILGGTALMARLERRSPFSYGLADRHWPARFSFGALIGWLSLTLMLAGMQLGHHFDFGSEYMHGTALAIASVTNLFSFLVEVTLFEEILFRGYALYTLSDGIGFWPAAVLLSLLFAAAHIQNRGEAKVGIIAVAVFGMMLCFSVWRTGSLLWAIGFHFMWDYSESFLYGVPDSGFVSPEHLLSTKFAGPAWITGGTVGPEGSWFIFVVLAAVAVLIHFMYPTPAFGIVDNRVIGSSGHRVK